MSPTEFPYAFHKKYLMPIVPLLIEGHKVWAYIDSGATFSILSVDDARRIGLAWQTGRRQMIVVGDGSFIPTYLFDLRLHIGGHELTAPIGFSERLGVGFNILGRTGIFDQLQICFNDRLRKLTFQKISMEKT
jgi:Aspartyl protease